MSAIAWDGRTLAADRLAVFGSAVHEAEKIFAHEGVRYGAVGDFNQCTMFREWVESGMSRDAVPGPNGILDDISTIEIEEGKLYARDGCSLLVRIPIGGADVWAIGRGKDLAMGAMMAGCSAMKAVRFACMQDIYCDCMGKDPDFLAAPLKDD